jgi:thiol-disulfide isomerase/thioredoxin
MSARPVLAALLAALALLAGCGTGTDAVEPGGEFTFVAPGGQTTILYDPPESRGALPALSGESLLNPGTTVGLEAFRGRVVVVNVWGSWCGPCKLEFPYFRRAAAKLGTRVAFLALNVEDSRADAQRFLRRSPVPYPSLEDGDGKLLREAAPGVKGLPVTIYYDAKGEQTFVHQGGYRSEAELVEDIERYAGA